MLNMVKEVKPCPDGKIKKIIYYTNNFMVMILYALISKIRNSRGIKNDFLDAKFVHSIF